MKMERLSSRNSRRIASWLLACAALAGPGSALADGPSKADLAKARTAFQEGVALAAANNCTAALVKYKEVAQVKMTAQVAFNIAECEERLGKLMQSLGNYRVAVAQAGDDKRAARVMQEAGSRVDALVARIPKLTLTREKGLETATIQLDGSEIGESQLGVAMPLDPGAHVVVAKLQGKEYFHQSVKLAEKETKTFHVKFELPKVRVEVAPTDQPTEPPPPPPKSRVPGIAITAAGGVALIVGLVMLAPRGAAISELDKVCKDGRCPPDAESTASRGKLFTGLTEVLVPVGVVGVAVGIALIATSGPQKAKSDAGDGEKKASFLRSIEVLPAAPGASVGGVSLAGRF